MQSIFFALVADESGQGAIEYAILLGGLSTSVLMALYSLGLKMTPVFARITQGLDQITSAQS